MKKKKWTKFSTEKLNGNGHGFVKMNRSDLIDEVIAKNKNAWCVFSLIAKRCWRGQLKNRHGCASGEAFVGDYATYGFTRMEYRTALSCLENFGLIKIATSKKGTTVTLVTTEIFDINVESVVTDRVVEQPTSNQGATKVQPTSNQGATIKQPTSNQGATTNKKTIREEDKEEKKKKDNNNNNAADAGVAGGVLHPADVPAAGAAGGGEEVQPPAPVGDMPEPYVEMTPDQKAMELSKELPRYIKRVARLNQRPVFTADALQGAVEWFQRNINHEWWDVQAICALGIKNAREVPAPEEGFDPYFWSRKYAHKPNKLFEACAEGDLHLTLIMTEGKWADDDDHDAEWASQLTDTEWELADGNRQ